LLAAAMNFVVATGASIAVLAAAGVTSFLRQRRRVPSTMLKAKKKRTSIGPKKLKSGYWQEDDDDDDDIDIFEWISAEDLEDEPPVTLSAVREIAAYSQLEDFPTERYAAPEYRPPERPLQLQKGIKKPPPLDETRERHFVHDVIEAVNSHGHDSYSLEELDVVASSSSIKMLLAFVEGSLTADMMAKGLTTRRRNEPVAVDLMRITRMRDFPNAICLSTVWNWVPSNSTASVGSLNRMSYDVSFERAATGKPLLAGPPSTRNPIEPLHYRMLECDCGGLRMLIRTPTMAMVPSVDVDDLEGRGVEMESVNRRDVADLWGSTLPLRFAEMELGDVGMIVRGEVDKGSLTGLQEVTREDMRLDQPAVAAGAKRLLGGLAGLLRTVREVADCPGCKDRPLYIQFHDSELRIISPVFDGEFDESEEVDEEEVQEVLRYVAGGVPIR